MLTVYTAQYRYSGPNRTDITVRGAKPPWDVFAPTWAMVNEYNKGPKDEEAEQVYTEKYNAIMDKAFMYNNKALMTLINSDETRVLVCFCGIWVFCHKVLLARRFESLGATYEGTL